MPINPQANELNDAIKAANPHVFSLLSDKGKSIYFPKRGILAQTAEAAGKEINATIGTALEDNGNPMCLESLSRQINLSGKQIFAYAPSPGRAEIRSLWKDMLYRKNPSLKGATVSLPVVTSALTHGLSMAGYLFVDKGDTIILPDLFWENYELIFSLSCCGKLKTYPMFSKGGFNVDGLRKALNSGKKGKKIVMLNFPNNPTGYTATIEEGRRIIQVLLDAAEAGNDLAVLIDDAYFGLVFEDGIMQESLFGLLAQAHDRILAIKFDGPTKEDYVWGFRVGFVTFGNKKNSGQLFSALEAKLGGAIRGNISNASNLGQSLLIAAYGDPHYEEEKTKKFETLKRRYQKVKEILQNHPEYNEIFTPLPFNSGYFMCVKIKTGNAEPIRQLLIRKYSTGIIALDDLIRVAFSSTPLSMLERLFDNIYWAGKEAAGAAQ
jgi:aspartate/methionine/tyrosine aminotransferase